MPTFYQWRLIISTNELALCCLVRVEPMPLRKNVMHLSWCGDIAQCDCRLKCQDGELHYTDGIGWAGNLLVCPTRYTSW